VTTPTVDQGSFRDRESRVFVQDGRVLRGLTPIGLAEWERLAGSDFFGSLAASGHVPRTSRVDDIDLDGLRAVSPRIVAVLEHERLPFVSYPYEWCFSMLRDAALLTLDVLAGALAEGVTLKDASAYNVQWRGSQPVFIDIGSFEAWRAGEPWVGYLQFCQHFLYPLMLEAYRGAPFQPWLRGSLDGIRSREMAALLSLRDRFRRGVLAHVLLQARFSRRAGSEHSLRRDIAESGFRKGMILRNVASLRSTIAAMHSPLERSDWSEYSETHSYSAADYEAKQRFVEDALRQCAPRSVWDLGCNTGEFSLRAATVADHVLAIDGDPVAVDRLYRRLRGLNTKILPLVVRLTDPSPGLGWRGRERAPLDRRGSPDLVLALAVVHHLVLTENVPVAEVVDWLADLDAALVIEFVSKNDPMVQRLLRDKVDNYDDWERSAFEAVLASRFSIAERHELDSGTRFLYLARPLPMARRSGA
jgi:SAM-dependent methyltransferase